jgi:hypothetical protein
MKIAVIKNGVKYLQTTSGGTGGPGLSVEDVQVLLDEYVKAQVGNAGIINNGNSATLSKTNAAGITAAIGVDDDGSQILVLDDNNTLLHSLIIDKNGVFVDGKSVATKDLIKSKVKQNITYLNPDGIKTEFDFTEDYQLADFYLNGLRLIKDEDYTITADKLTLPYAPAAEESLYLITYSLI